jgi:hypothetical protein
MKCGEEGPIQRWRESVIRENVSVREDYINTAYQKTGLLIILIIYSTYVLYNYDESIYIIIYISHNIDYDETILFSYSTL